MRSSDTLATWREATVMLCALGCGPSAFLVAQWWQGTHGGHERAGCCLSLKV